MERVENKRKVYNFRELIVNIAGDIIKIVLGIILFILSIASIVYTCKLCDTDTLWEFTFYNKDNIFKYVIIIIGMIVMYKIYIVLKRNNKIIKYKSQYGKKIDIYKLLICMHCILGIGWVVCTQLTPRADQGFCSAIAANLFSETYDKADFLKGGYLNQYPFQSGIILVFKIIYSLFGINNYMAFQILNVVSVVLIDIYLMKVLKKITAVHAEKIGILFLILFFPMVFYTSFLYGNLMGCAFSTMAMYYEFEYFENHKVCNMILSTVFIGIALMIKSNYLIVLLAMLIFLGIDWIISLKKKNIIFAVIVICSYIIATSGPVKLLSIQENVYLGKGIPKIAWIAMGMQETGMAPGWYNGYNADTYLNNDCDSEKTAEEAQKYIRERMTYFAENPIYTIKFYTKKMLSQWCEPTFGGIWINQFEKNVTISRYLDSILNGGKLQKIVIEVLDVLQSFVYWLAFLYVITNRKRKNIFIWFPGTVFIGGFLFHMIWEGKGQYAFTYFLLLIPYAAIEAKMIVDYLTNKADEKYGK